MFEQLKSDIDEYFESSTNFIRLYALNQMDVTQLDAKIEATFNSFLKVVKTFDKTVEEFGNKELEDDLNNELKDSTVMHMQALRTLLNYDGTKFDYVAANLISIIKISISAIVELYAYLALVAKELHI